MECDTLIREIAESVNSGLRGCVKMVNIIKGALKVSKVPKAKGAGYLKPVSILKMWVLILGLLSKSAEALFPFSIDTNIFGIDIGSC